MACFQLTQTVADAFNALADEVQVLSDRKTILEHKLRFAHEQFQYLADKYAPAAPEIAETLAKLQLPAHTSVDDTLPVPLPKQSSLQSPHQIALLIRDGRRAANKLVASLGEASKTTASSRDTLSQTSHVETSISTAMEQDFTLEGKKGNLQCPFAKDAAAHADRDQKPETGPDSAPNRHEDPICAAMYEEETSQHDAVNGTQASKCPIRFLDKHSPEEIAHYVETHKHELPRSHEVCVRRYQRNEEQIRKLDAKYGNIVSMIEDLSQLHKPMLPDDEHARRPSDATRTSADRVESWAHAVSSSTDPEAPAEPPADMDEERQSHFDRPLKEVRVGESPSRPWGISVPVAYEQSGNGADHPMSPPPAPVRMPSPVQSTQTPAKPAGKCPFGHTANANPSAFAGLNISASPDAQTQNAPVANGHDSAPFTPTKPCHERRPAHDRPASIPQPAFINPDASKATGGPQMIFTGPVFIGYPMEQAIQFMNQYPRS